MSEANNGGRGDRSSEKDRHRGLSLQMTRWGVQMMGACEGHSGWER